MDNYTEAAESVNTPVKLKKRLREAVAVLKPEYRKQFPAAAMMVFEKKCLLSPNGMYALVWKNDGCTSRGLVSLRRVVISIDD